MATVSNKEPKNFTESIELLGQRLAGVPNLKTGDLKNSSKVLNPIVQNTVKAFMKHMGVTDADIPFFKVLVKDGSFNRLLTPSIANVRGVPSLIFPNGTHIDIRKALVEPTANISIIQESNNNVKYSYLCLSSRDKAERNIAEIKTYLALNSNASNLGSISIVSAIENLELKDGTYTKADEDETSINELLKEHTFSPNMLEPGEYVVSSFGKDNNLLFMEVNGLRYINYEFRHKQFVLRQNDGLPVRIKVGDIDQVSGFRNIVVYGFEPTKYMTGFVLNELITEEMETLGIDFDIDEKEALAWFDSQIEAATNNTIKNWLTGLKLQKYVPIKNKLFLAGYGEQNLRSGYTFHEPNMVKIVGVADLQITERNNKPNCLVIEHNGRQYNLGNNSTTASWLSLKMLDLKSFDNVFIVFKKVEIMKGKTAFKIDISLERPQSALLYTLDQSDLESMYL